jgi:rod shape-determining protein MreD
MNSMRARHENETTFHPVVLVATPILALILQAYVPHLFPQFVILDLPLLVVIYFAITLRGAIEGTIMGMLIGLVQDAQTGRPIGVNGMAKSIIGYAAASIGVRIDVENTVSRMLLTAVFTLANSVLIYTIERRLLGFETHWLWLYETVRIIANALVSVVVFWILDRLRRKG